MKVDLGSRVGSRISQEVRFDQITILTLLILADRPKRSVSDTAESVASDQDLQFATHPTILHLFTGSKMDLWKRSILK